MRAKVALLVMVLPFVVAGIDFGFTLDPDNRGLRKIRRNAERATGPALAIRAVAYSMHCGQAIDGDGCLPAGTSCCHWQWFPM